MTVATPCRPPHPIWNKRPFELLPAHWTSRAWCPVAIDSLVKNADRSAGGSPQQKDAGRPPHVLIIGAGFAGLECAKALGGQPIRVTIVDRNNYHLFVPLLYQVATAALSPADIAQPIRRILRRYENIDVVLGEVGSVDAKAKSVALTDGRWMTYDILVVATGSEYSYFGHDEWRAFAPAPRTIEDARRIRSTLLLAFERAELCDDPQERTELMTIVIVGGGPTGVEMAGSVAELARFALARDFRHIDPTSARVILVEAGPRLLTAFPESLSDYARRALERLGVTALLNTKVENIDAHGVTLADGAIRARTVIWGAGVQASGAGRWFGLKLDRSQQIPVEPDLKVRGLHDIYALGDTVHSIGDDGKPLPALAQVAKQQGRHLGRALARRLTRGTPIPPFQFKNRGNTAIIGRNAAVFDFGRLRLVGWPAYILWAIVHVYLLVGFQNRLLVLTQWVWRYLTYQRGARLISEG